MPGQRRDHIEVTVFIRYFGPKASQFNATDFTAAFTILKADLLTLKISHPKGENVFVSPGCVQFFWRTTTNSPLHKSVIQRTRPTASERIAHERTLNELSIAEMVMQETIIPKPTPSKPAPATKRRLHPYPPPQPQLQPQPQPQHPSRSRVPSQIGEPSYAHEHQVNQRMTPPEPAAAPVHVSTPHQHSSSDTTSIVMPNIHMNAETQRLLHELDVSFRSRGMLKTEPIENILIPEPMQAGPAATSFRTMSPPPLPLAQKPLLLPAPEASTPAFPPYLPHVRPTHPLPTPPTSFSSIQAHVPTPTPTPTPLSTRPPPPLPPPPPMPHAPNSNPAEITRLTRELWDIRRQVTAGVAREAAILQHLRRLNAPNIPEVQYKHDSVMKARLQMVERELQSERKRRVEAEESLRDVERECKEPFVVPALLEAFVAISKVTTQAQTAPGVDEGTRDRWGVV